MGYRIKNWKKFQHFRDRKPPWIKLYREILDDLDWHNLKAEDAKALVMLWLLASESDGDLPSVSKIAFRLRLTKTAAEQILSRLSHWLDQDDIAPISSRYQDDTPEREREGETETESVLTHTPRARARSVENFSPDLEEAKKRGWASEAAEAEALRFRDHALAKGRTCKDWRAAWRNWLDSPYQQRNSKNGAVANGNDRRPGESLGDLGRRLAAEARELEHSQGIGRKDDPFGGN